jgi:hypothetical protein
MRLDELTSADFIRHLHQPFRITLEGVAPIDLELIDVAVYEGDQNAATGNRKPFSLLFLGPVSNHYLLQHTYHVENEQMGLLDLFIVPLGPKEGRMQYEAVIG